jgi:hypothetical protein
VVTEFLIVLTAGLVIALWCVKYLLGEVQELRKAVLAQDVNSQAAARVLQWSADMARWHNALREQVEQQQKQLARLLKFKEAVLDGEAWKYEEDEET